MKDKRNSYYYNRKIFKKHLLNSQYKVDEVVMITNWIKKKIIKQYFKKGTEEMKQASKTGKTWH